jgi:putative oxidoreductase
VQQFTLGVGSQQNAKSMDALAKLLPALGRIFLALIFVLSGLRKLGAIGATAAQMASYGIPFSSLLVWGAVALELGGGLMLMSGLAVRWVALALCLYTLALAVIFHAYWALPPAEARSQFSVFFEHIAMMGGMLYVVAFGAGAYSLDNLMGRRK